MATAAAKTAPGRAATSPFMKALTPSAALAAVVGPAPLARTEVVKQLWVYIKVKNLQDEASRRSINAGATLLPIFGKAQVPLFEMSGLVGKPLTWVGTERTQGRDARSVPLFPKYCQ
ncbi:SWIB/MDM2 domain-containing protein [Variovorax saccharolyticus]|uniref:SWIB/MDM2 domain-containing protein n=1 Tax=Variovorax saccharolyticus TaxID=3053516 RepID=UPI0025781F5E|nr:SWIB/MDM2 domain-containing protein [Variovorax sp. J31P216]MDM0030473.1 SWIB/MDM2 domain-containing protein [Variovorax sp. J31P216]